MKKGGSLLDPKDGLLRVKMLWTFVACFGLFFLKQHRAVRDLSKDTLPNKPKRGMPPQVPECQQQDWPAAGRASPHRPPAPAPALLSPARTPHVKTHRAPRVRTSLRHPPRRGSKPTAPRAGPRRDGARAPSHVPSHPPPEPPGAEPGWHLLPEALHLLAGEKRLYLPMIATCAGSMPAGAGR